MRMLHVLGVRRPIAVCAADGTACVYRSRNEGPITASSLLGALEVLNARVDAKFSRGLAEMTIKLSMKPEPWQLEQAGATVVCEDSRLSLAGFGIPYKVINKKLIKQEVVTIDNEELHFLLDIASSAYAVEDSCPTGAATKKLKWQITASEGFHKGREAIRMKVLAAHTAP